jgi:catechol 2,3-dioxygenase-like lactoylglutathione lyase family enzyme
MSQLVVGIRANLEVRDVPQSIDFYRGALALEPVTTMGEPPVFALLAATPTGPGDSPSLGLSASPAPAVAAIVACYVDVADVAAVFDRCRAARVEVTMELTTHPWGMRDFVIRDPDGHQLAIGQRMAARPEP